MGNQRSDRQAEEMSRRELLGKGAALMGAAVAGMALGPATASGEINPEGAAGKQFDVKGASAMLPNLDPPVAQVAAGKLRGFRDGRTTVFLGIPYAEAERFELPRPVTPWDGVKSAQAWGPVCPIHNMTEPGVDEFVFPHRYWLENEHCQVLNIWTQNLSPAVKKPVMVWMHGGGFSNGSSMEAYAYDGKNLSEYGDVVVVSMNHRLNIIGTLDLSAYGPQYAQSRYTGTADLVTCLQWIHDNIENFGGDPGNVTIFGQSGGGGKVSTLMAMPPAKGLFQRAIVQSGAAVRGVPKEVATKSAAAFMAKLGLQPNQVDQLQQMPMQQLLDTMGSMTGNGMPGSGAGLVLSPVVDGTTLPVNPFDPTAPEISKDIPLLIGTVETEVTFFPGQQLDPIDEANLHARVKGFVRKASDEQVDQLIAAYRAGRPTASNTDLFLIIASDATFRAGVVTEAERKAAPGNAPVYQYYFTWRSPVRDGKLRTFHTLEIPFVFDNVDGAKSMTGDGQDRYALASKISGAWVAFARTGNPNHPGLADWPAFDTTRRATMILNDECRAVDDPYGDAQRMLRALQSA